MPLDTPPATPELLAFRTDAVVVRFALQATEAASACVQSLYALLQDNWPEGVVEIAPALASVFLRFDPDQVAQTDLMDRLQALLATQDWSHAKVPPPKRVWTVPVNFDAEFAPQLAEVAGILNTTETQVIKQITSAEPRVLAIGFAPGQPYLGLLPEEWNFPRLPELSPKVPAGALLAAVRQLVLFTNENATGWRQIGQSAFRPFQPSSSDPFPLHPGDAVRFTAIGTEEFRQLIRDGADPMGGALCKVQS